MARWRPGQVGVVASTYVVGIFLIALDTTIVNVTLTSLSRDLDVPAGATGSVGSAYLLSMAVFIPASGWLGDRFGGRRVLLGAMLLFTVASTLCGLAQSLPQLLGARVLQGAAGGIMQPIGLALLYRMVPPQDRIRISAITTIPTGLAPAMGPVIGGLLTEQLSWRWAFYLNVPVGLLAVGLGAVYLHEHRFGGVPRFDRTGFLLAAGGFASLLFGITEGVRLGWGSAPIIAALGTGVVLLVSLVVVELRSCEPIIDLRLLTDRPFRVASSTLAFGSMAFVGWMYAMAQYLQAVLGLSPLQAGLSTLPQMAGMVLGAQLCSRLLHPRWGSRTTSVVGFTLLTFGMATLAVLPPDAPRALILVAMLVVTLGVPPIFIASQAGAFLAVSHADTARASTFYSMQRQLFGALGVATAATLAATVARAGGDLGDTVTSSGPYRVVFALEAALAITGAVLSTRYRDIGRSSMAAIDSISR